MDANFESSKYILPFCRHEAVNGKGGTATVFQVSIQKQLVIDKNLENAIEESLHTDDNFGEVSTALLNETSTQKV